MSVPHKVYLSEWAYGPPGPPGDTTLYPTKNYKMKEELLRRRLLCNYYHNGTSVQKRINLEVCTA